MHKRSIRVALCILALTLLFGVFIYCYNTKTRTCPVYHYQITKLNETEFRVEMNDCIIMSDKTLIPVSYSFSLFLLDDTVCFGQDSSKQPLFSTQVITLESGKQPLFTPLRTVIESPMKTVEIHPEEQTIYGFIHFQITNPDTNKNEFFNPEFHFYYSVEDTTILLKAA